MKAKKRRMTDPLNPLVPLARLAAVGLVAAVGALIAINLEAPGTTPASVPAQGTGAALTTRVSATPGTSNVQVATNEATMLLHEVKVPPGSVQLTARPSDAPALEQAPFLPQASTMVTRTTWWTSTLSQADTLAWMRAHPAAGLIPSITGTSLIGFQGNGSGVIDQITVYAEAFTLPGGKTGIQLSSVVIYQPVRPAQETIPAAAKLVATPGFPWPKSDDGAPATFTDQTEISHVAQIINALRTIPLGTYSCPNDSGGRLALDFESAGGTILAQVSLMASGCGGTLVKTHGEQQPELAGGASTIQQIQSVLGTHWQVTPTLP